MKRTNTQSVISLSNLKEIKNIIDPGPSTSELRKRMDLELKKISQERTTRWENSRQNANLLELNRQKNIFTKKEQ